MNELKILHLRSSEFFGGPERAIVGQCRHLSSFQFVCASFVRRHKPNRFLEEVSRRGITAEAIEESCVGDFRVISQIKNVIAKHQIDILVSHDYKADFFGLLASKHGKVRQIAHFRGTTAEDVKARVSHFFDRLLLRRMSTVIAVSEGSRRILQGKGIPPEIIRVVPNAIEDEKLVKAEFRKQLPNNRPIEIVAAGRLSHEKGYDILLEAIAHIHKQAPPFRVNIYGLGPEKSYLEKMVKPLGIDTSVKFCGFVDNVLPILNAADLMILPSRSEGMPNILLEAWSQKLGVVATAVGGVPEMMEHEVNGLLVPPENPKLLGENMLLALTHPDLMIACGEKGYDSVMGKYNYRIQAELLSKIYGEEKQRLH